MESEILNTLLEIKELVDNNAASWIPALFTLVGTVSGAVVIGYWQHKSTKINLHALDASKQLEIKSELVSKQRQQWMDRHREACASFLSEYDAIVSDIGEDHRSQKEHLSLYLSANEKANYMILMLNQEKPTQEKAVQAIANIQNIITIYNEKGADIARQKYDVYRSDLIHTMNEVFNETWGKIKSFE